MEKSIKQSKGKFITAVGKRKTAIASIRLVEQKENKEVIINEKTLSEYFNNYTWQKTVLAPLNLCGLLNHYHITIKVSGGGPNSQAEAIRHGISKAILIIDPNYRKALKAVGYLRRDPRKKERKKPGLKRARRAPQWHKR